MRIKHEDREQTTNGWINLFMTAVIRYASWALSLAIDVPLSNQNEDNANKRNILQNMIFFFVKSQFNYNK